MIEQPKVLDHGGMMAHIRAKVAKPGESTVTYGGLGPNEARFLLGEVDKLTTERDALREEVERMEARFRATDAIAATFRAALENIAARHPNTGLLIQSGNIAREVLTTREQEAMLKAGMVPISALSGNETREATK